MSLPREMATPSLQYLFCYQENRDDPAAMDHTKSGVHLCVVTKIIMCNFCRGDIKQQHLQTDAPHGYSGHDLGTKFREKGRSVTIAHYVPSSHCSQPTQGRGENQRRRLGKFLPCLNLD